MQNRQTSTADSFTVAVKNSLNLVFADNSIALPKASRLLLAFSGGPDSAALLIALAQFAQEYELEVQVCHINHALRGKESDEDEEFCRSLSRRYNLEFHTIRLSGTSRSEADLRKLRYQHLEEVAAQIDAKYCITGHTLDDQIETMLFRMFRGTGPSGLLGIPSYRKVSERLYLLRPLLGIKKIDCISFLARTGISARFDSSNHEDNYSRNFIRNQISPLIESRFPGFGERMDQLRKVIEADESLLNCLSRDAVLDLTDKSSSSDIWNLDEFNELPLSLRRRVLCDSLRQRNIECDFARIECLLEKIDLDGDAAVCLNDEWELRLVRGELNWKRRLDKQAEPIEFDALAIPLRKEGLTLIHKLGLAINIEKVEEPTKNVRLPGSQELEVIGDLSCVDELKVRLRTAGDQIQPLGMNCMVRLKKFLHTHKSSKTLSFGGRVLVIANHNEVLWVPGCGMSQRIAIGNRATHRIRLFKIAPDDNAIC